MSKARQRIGIVILDLDNNLTDTLKQWSYALHPLIQDMRTKFGVPLETTHDLIREAPGQFRFNDGVSLVDWMRKDSPHIRDAFARVSTGTPYSDPSFPVKQDWLRRSAEQTTFYGGVIPMLKLWNAAGTRVVIQTDCEDCAVTRRLWLLGQDASRKGDLAAPGEILNLIDAVYCQPGIRDFSPLYHAEVPHNFIAALDSKTIRWDDRQFKPSSVHMQQILDDAQISARNALYVGDTHKDGIEAHTLKVEFAWALYGAHVEPETLALYKQVGSSNYTYGVDAIKRAMDSRGVIPQVTLQESMEELRTRYDWIPSEP